jgi:hypothetical protein
MFQGRRHAEPQRNGPRDHVCALGFGGRFAGCGPGKPPRPAGAAYHLNRSDPVTVREAPK